MSPFTTKTLALAGVCQAAALVQAIARTQPIDTEQLQASLNSLLVTDPDNTEQVYGCKANLTLGLRTLCSQLSNQAKGKDAELTRYIAAMLGLERKLKANPQKVRALTDGIIQAKRQLAHVELLSGQMLASLAGLYSDIISPLAPRIQVAGDPTTLKQHTNQDKVRALLLSGLRSAVLWRQLGGKRRHILWQRRKIIQHSQTLLQQC